MKGFYLDILIPFLIYGLSQSECQSQPDSRNHNIVTYSSSVFQAGDGNYDFYRIPSLLFADNHIYAFAEGRKNSLSDHGQIDIVMKISDDQGKTWGDLTIITDFNNQSSQNPTPVYIKEEHKIILLFTKRTVASDTEDKIREGTSEGYVGAYVTESVDKGNTWSEIVEITDDVKLKNWRWYAFGPGGAIIIQNVLPYKGRIIVPANHSSLGGKGNEFLGAHIVYSDDSGKSWHIGAVDSEGAGSVNPNELTVVENRENILYFNTRNQNSRPDSISNRAITYSHDGGITFKRKFFHEPQLITPVVHASIIRSKENIIFIAPNDDQERKNLAMWISKNETQTWLPPILLQEGFAAYSSSVMLAENLVGILYESGIDQSYQTILFIAVILD